MIMQNLFFEVQTLTNNKNMSIKITTYDIDKEWKSYIYKDISTYCENLYIISSEKDNE